jgi:hypothetical protein
MRGPVDLGAGSGDKHGGHRDRRGAPGSRLVCENMSGRDGADVAVQDRLNNAVENWCRNGFDVEMIDLWCFDDRHDVADYLNGRPFTGPDQETADFGSLPT